MKMLSLTNLLLLLPLLLINCKGRVECNRITIDKCIKNIELLQSRNKIKYISRIDYWASKDYPIWVVLIDKNKRLTLTRNFENNFILNPGTTSLNEQEIKTVINEVTWIIDTLKIKSFGIFPEFNREHYEFFIKDIVSDNIKEIKNLDNHDICLSFNKMDTNIKIDLFCRRELFYKKYYISICSDIDKSKAKY